MISFFDEFMNATKQMQEDWVHTKPQLEPLKIKPGKPMYIFLDIDFTLNTATDEMTMRIIRLNIKEVIPNFTHIAKLTGAVNMGNGQAIMKHIWKYLIQEGLFPYPVETLN